MNIFEKLEDVARGVESSLKSEMTGQDIKSEIAKENRIIESTKQKIGDYYWKKYCEGQIKDEEIEPLFIQMKQAADRIKELREKIENSATSSQATRVQTIQCPKCGHQNRKDVNFCGQCGENLRQTGTLCPACGAENTPGTTFCGQCGKHL